MGGREGERWVKGSKKQARKQKGSKKEQEVFDPHQLLPAQHVPNLIRFYFQSTFENIGTNCKKGEEKMNKELAQILPAQQRVEGSIGAQREATPTPHSGEKPQQWSTVERSHSPAFDTLHFTARHLTVV